MKKYAFWQTAETFLLFDFMKIRNDWLSSFNKSLPLFPFFVMQKELSIENVSLTSNSKWPTKIIGGFFSQEFDRSRWKTMRSQLYFNSA